eukprot:RCo034192
MDLHHGDLIRVVVDRPDNVHVRGLVFAERAGRPTQPTRLPVIASTQLQAVVRGEDGAKADAPHVVQASGHHHGLVVRLNLLIAHVTLVTARQQLVAELDKVATTLNHLQLFADVLLQLRAHGILQQLRSQLVCRVVPMAYKFDHVLLDIIHLVASLLDLACIRPNLSRGLPGYMGLCGWAPQGRDALDPRILRCGLQLSLQLLPLGILSLLLGTPLGDELQELAPAGSPGGRAKAGPNEHNAVARTDLLKELGLAPDLGLRVEGRGGVPENQPQLHRVRDLALHHVLEVNRVKVGDTNRKRSAAVGLLNARRDQRIVRVVGEVFVLIIAVPSPVLYGLLHLPVQLLGCLTHIGVLVGVSRGRRRNDSHGDTGQLSRACAWACACACTMLGRGHSGVQ